MILCTGFYNRSNLGDDIFEIIFESILKKLNSEYIIKSLDDIQTISSDIDTIILGGGEILNSYFLQKLQKLCVNFNGKIIAYSCELPKGNIINEINLIDYFIMRNPNDVIRLKQHFNLSNDKPNPYIEYLPDLVCSLKSLDSEYYIKNIEKQLTQQNQPIKESTNKVITVCLARSIFKDNTHYDFYLKKITLFLKYINYLGWEIVLLPFNTSKSITESDLLLNLDIEKLCKVNNFSVTNIIPNNTWSEHEKLNNVLSIIKSSDIVLCSRYHAHILGIVCEKPILSICHTKKAKDQMFSFGLEKWICEPLLDLTNKPIDFDVELAITIFNDLVQNYSKVLKSIKSLKFLTIDQHKNKLENLLKLNKRTQPPFYVDNLFCDDLINKTIRHVLDVFKLTNLQEERPYEIKYRITKCILYMLCKDSNSPYFYGLNNKILKSNFNYLEEFKWICKDYYSKNPKNITFNTNIKEQPIENKIFNLKYIEPHMLENIHRSGWYNVVHNTGVLENDSSESIILDMFVDRTFHWNEELYQDLRLIPYNRPWIGIVHHTPNQNYTQYNTSDMIRKDIFKKSQSNCIGIFTLSEWLANWFKTEIPELQVESLIHPTDIPKNKFIFEKFMENKNKKIVQIGGWLRNPYSIYRINVPNNFQKIHLVGKNMENYIKPVDSFEELLSSNESFYNGLDQTNQSSQITLSKSNQSNQSISRDQSGNKYVYFMHEFIKQAKLNNKDTLELLNSNHNSVKLMETLDNDDYDTLLSDNVVFIDLIEASACNTLLECIVRNTPILVKPLPAIVERLGLDYPMYWNDYSDISNLLTNDNIKKTHEYLKSLDKSCYTYDYWIDSIVNSKIFKDAQHILYPKLNRNSEVSIKSNQTDKSNKSNKTNKSNINLVEIDDNNDDAVSNKVKPTSRNKFISLFSCCSKQ